MISKSLFYLILGYNTITGAPKRYILDKIDKGFTNVPLISQRRYS